MQTVVSKNKLYKETVNRNTFYRNKLKRKIPNTLAKLKVKISFIT